MPALTTHSGSIGVDGRNVEAAVLGSVTSAVVQSCRVPVIVARRSKEGCV
ncbi:MAG TPA: hypothetical protein VFP27_17690 [Mycobacterium sp.]|nr:hypothetical protein [Mycobacterium sp.]